MKDMNNQHIPTEKEVMEGDNEEHKKVFQDAKYKIADKLEAILKYISFNTPELKQDLEIIKNKCDMFRPEGLCPQCVIYSPDDGCVFWDKHYVQYVRLQKK